jgi:hypothetical protein
MSPTPVVAVAGPANSTPRGPTIDIFGNTYQGGHRSKHYRYKQATWRKNGGKSFGEIFLGPCGAKNPGIIIPLQRLSPNQQTMV